MLGSFLLLFVMYGGSCFIYLFCIYLSILVYNTISMSDDVRVA